MKKTIVSSDRERTNKGCTESNRTTRKYSAKFTHSTDHLQTFRKSNQRYYLTFSMFVLFNFNTISKCTNLPLNTTPKVLYNIWTNIFFAWKSIFFFRFSSNFTSLGCFRSACFMMAQYFSIGRSSGAFGGLKSFGTKLTSLALYHSKTFFE